MNTQALVEAQRAHVAAHGRDCGRGPGPSKNPCVALYRAWLHMSTGEWRVDHPVNMRLRSRAYAEANAGRVAAWSRDYRKANKDSIQTKKQAAWRVRVTDPEIREEINARRRESYHANRDLRLARRRANRDEINARQKAYREAHRDSAIARDRAYNESHKEERRAQRRAAREANPAKFNARQKAYREAHREDLRAYAARRRAARLTNVIPSPQ